MLQFTAKVFACALGVACAIPEAHADEPFTMPEGVQYRAKYQEQNGVSPGVWDVILTFPDANGEMLPAPEWNIRSEPTRADLEIPNVRVESNVKNVYLILTYTRSAWDGTPPDLSISAPGSVQNMDPIRRVRTEVGETQAMVFYHWRLFPQPAMETILWPDLEGYDLAGGLECVEVGTWCIPAPGAWALIGIAVLPLASRRRAS